MASEILAVPEQHLADVIWIIREGIDRAEYNFAERRIAPEVMGHLSKWCDDMERYMGMGIEGIKDKEDTQ